MALAALIRPSGSPRSCNGIETTNESENLRTILPDIAAANIDVIFDVAREAARSSSAKPRFGKHLKVG
jgi:hypothetical protein